MTTTTERTALYRLLAANGRLLYVGISSNPDFRWGTHSNKQPWWNEVADRKIEWFPDRDAAADAEVKAIKEERPLYNKQHAARGFVKSDALPQDVDAEQIVLGRMMLSWVAIDEAAAVLTPGHFSRPAHSTIYRSIIRLRKSGHPVDPIVVGAELTKRGHITAVGGQSYLRCLAEAALPSSDTKPYAQLVHQRSTMGLLTHDEVYGPVSSEEQTA